MTNIMNDWLEQAEKFADYLADEAKKLVVDVQQVGYEDYNMIVEDSNSDRYFELVMLSVAAGDIGQAIMSTEAIFPEMGRYNGIRYLEDAFETASHFSSPEAEKVRKAARRVGAKLFGITL